MKTINLMCIEDAIKPKIRLKHYGGIVCLIDTGADTPVWCASIYKFLRLFPDATKTELKFIISGFGGDANTKAEVADVYKLPELKLGSIEEYILCKGMYS